MTDKMFERYISPRKRMSMGDKDPLAVGDYGVAHMDSMAAGASAVEEGDDYMPDHKRGAPPPIQGNQSAPDHGPTHYNHKNWSKA